MKIMIVDDEALILAGIENIIINEFGEYMEIATAVDGIDALDKLKAFTPDLIITDICMPEMTGLELIEKVLKTGICSRFIILSGYADFEYAKQAMHYKALDYILKPIDKTELVELLKRISKNIEQEKEKIVKEKLNKIKDILFYNVKDEDFFANENLINKIFPFTMFMVFVIQTDQINADIDTTGFDKVLPYFFNKYLIYSFKHKDQRIILTNFEQKICGKELYNELYKELSCIQSESNTSMTNIGISTVSDKIEAIHILYNDALRKLHYSKYSWDNSVHEESNIRKAFSMINYGDIAAILEAKSDEDMLVLLNNHVEKLLSINSNSPVYLNSVYYIIISDITIYLEGLGMTFDDVIGVNPYVNNEIVNDVELKNQVRNIIAQVWKYLMKKDMGNKNSESVSKMLEYINKNYMKDISLDNVAETVKLHPNYASSLFKKEIGTSFINYLNSYRIMKAKCFIKGNAELSLEKIAEMVGYESSGRFIKVFKKYCDITPGEYRNKISSFQKN